MEFAHNGEIKLAFESFGQETDPAMLLIIGLGGHMVDWDDTAVGDLVAAGFRVIRFDNRDIGLSTQLTDLGIPDLVSIFLGGANLVPYSLSDMGDDALAVLDHLGIEQAHIVGVSMGGMIAQQLLVDHPEVGLSLASLMSTTGAKGVGHPSPAIVQMILTSMNLGGPDPFELAKALASPGYEFDAEAVRRKIAVHGERSPETAGTLRQLAAVLAASDRTDGLRTLQLPTVIVHGRDDPLVDVSGAIATSEAVVGSKLVLVDGMGHDIPSALWPQIRDEIISNARMASTVSEL